MTRATPRLGHAPIAMRRVEDYAAIERAGDFYWDRDPDGSPTFVVAHPSPRRDEFGDGYTVINLPIRHGKNEPGKHWGWDGNEDTPTLAPSIHTHGHWHGFVRAGQLEEA